MTAERTKRSDAGTVKLTARDLAVFDWLAAMKTMWEPDLAVLLGRLSGDGPASASAVRRMLARWRKVGAADARRVFMDRPRLVFLTAAGAALAGEPNWRETALWTAMHAADVSRARLWLEGQEDGLDLPALPGLRVEAWQAERRIRQETAARFGGKVPAGVHTPDGVLTTPSGKRVAVEVERSPKDRDRLDRIVAGLTEPGGFDGVLYLTTGTAIEGAIRASYERARARGPVLPLDVLPMPEALS